MKTNKFTHILPELEIATKLVSAKNASIMKKVCILLCVESFACTELQLVKEVILKKMRHESSGMSTTGCCRRWIKSGEHTKNLD